MKKWICLMAGLISIQSHAVGSFSPEKNSSDPKEITSLYAATFSAPNSTGDNTLKYSYLTGGCTVEKTTYKLELIAENPQADQAGNIAFVGLDIKLHILDGARGSCRMFINIEDEVNLDKLLKENLSKLGLDKYDTKETLISAKFLIPPVIGYARVVEAE